MAVKDTIRVLIAEDQRLLRQCFEHLLAGDPEIEVVGSASNGREAVLQAVEQRPDVILMDLEMPVMGGLEATVMIHERCPSAKVLILTVHEEAHHVGAAVSEGVEGYIIKNVPPEDLLHIVKSVHRGLPVRSAHLKDDWLRAERERVITGLTEREREMLSMLAEGLSNPDMADRLCVSEQTVKRDMMNVLEILEVDNRTQAAIKILKYRLNKPRPAKQWPRRA